MYYFVSKIFEFLGGIFGAILFTFIIYCIAKLIQWIIFQVAYSGEKHIKFRFRITQNLLIMSVIMVFISYIPNTYFILKMPMLLILALAVYEQFKNEKK